jgi:signal transduction histidine kinase
LALAIKPLLLANRRTFGLNDAKSRLITARSLLEVTDNGNGLARSTALNDLAKSGKLGITGIKEMTRLLVGRLTMKSAPGKGTRIRVSVLA